MGFLLCYYQTRKKIEKEMERALVHETMSLKFP
jgi:hypothetical protein